MRAVVRAVCCVEHYLATHWGHKEAASAWEPRTSSHTAPGPGPRLPSCRPTVQGQVVDKELQGQIHLENTMPNTCPFFKKWPMAVHSPTKKLSSTQICQVYVTVQKTGFLQKNLSVTHTHTHTCLWKYYLSILIQLCTWNSGTLDMKPIGDRRTILRWKMGNTRVVPHAGGASPKDKDCLPAVF